MSGNENELLNKLAKKCSDKTQKLFLRIHKIIFKISPRNINYDIYPIYITYCNIKTDKVFTLIYLNKDHLDIGFSLKKEQKLRGAKSAGHMKYPGITKYVRTSSLNEIDFKRAFKMSFDAANEANVS